MGDSSIIVKKLDNEEEIYILSLHLPNQLNAINRRLLEDLKHELERLEKEKIDGLIINSTLAKAFCAGIDVGYVQSLSNEEAAALFADLATLFEKVSSFPCPTVAAVNGYAFGAGADLALACDIRISGESGRFRFPGPQFGVILGTHRLVNEVGASLARKIAFSNELIPAEKALEYGLIQEVTNDEETVNTAIDWILQLKNIPRHTYLGIRQICERLPDDKGLDTKTPSEYARFSVEEGDFNQQLTQYIDTMKKNRK